MRNTGYRGVLQLLFILAMAASCTPAARAAGASPASKSIFQVVPTPNTGGDGSLFAVSASSASDIWAVGLSAIHFDGAQWTAFPIATANGEVIDSLTGVADISPAEAWAVGQVNVGLAHPGQVIEHWDGVQWSVFQGPAFAPQSEPLLNAITAVSANDIWAVGSLLNHDLQVLNFLFEHWDGTSWTATAIESGDAFLLGASADASDDAWAVGFAGPENATSRTLVLHWDGASWKKVPSPSAGSGANQLNGVAALAPNDVWAVGFSTATPKPPPGQDRVPTATLIEHYDGTSWSVVPSPNIGPNSQYQSNGLLGITAVSPTDIWAFGSFDAANGLGSEGTLLVHWDGNTWSLAASPDPLKGDFLDDVLFAGVAPSPGDIWIVGSEAEFVPGNPILGSLAMHATLP